MPSARVVAMAWMIVSGRRSRFILLSNSAILLDLNFTLGLLPSSSSMWYIWLVYCWSECNVSRSPASPVHPECDREGWQRQSYRMNDSVYSSRNTGVQSRGPSQGRLQFRQTYHKQERRPNHLYATLRSFLRGGGIDTHSRMLSRCSQSRICCTLRIWLGNDLVSHSSGSPRSSI